MNTQYFDSLYHLLRIPRYLGAAYFFAIEAVNKRTMSAVVRSAQKLAVNVGARVGDMVNRLMPPEQRERALESLRAFSVRNPKLAVSLQLSDGFV